MDNQPKGPSPKLLKTLQLMDQLNAQIGIAGALVVDQYNQQKNLAQLQQPAYYPPTQPGYAPAPQPYQPYPQPVYPPAQPQGYYPPAQPAYGAPPPTYPQAPMQNPQQPNQQPQLPPIVQDFASLANILTQIQYDLFDITVTLAQQQTPDQLDSRIDDKAITWMTDIITKISSQLPQHQDPILPIGNNLATNFYMAKNLCQQVIQSLEILPPSENTNQIGETQASLHFQYINQLQGFMFVCFRWANAILRERDWYWKPKSQMQQQNQPTNTQQTQQPINQANPLPSTPTYSQPDPNSYGAPTDTPNRN